MRGTIDALPPSKKDPKRQAWRVTVYLGRDPITGKYGRSREIVVGPKRLAEQKRTEMLRALDTDTFVAATKATVGEYLSEWLTSYVATRIDRSKTSTGYKMIVNRHLIPTLGRIALRRLTPSDVQGYYGQALAGGRVSAKGKPMGTPLSATSVAHHHAVLHDALENAVKRGLIGRNVADAVDPPRIRRKELTVWGEDDVRHFLDAAKASRYYALFLLALTCGLRAGELFGLRWQDLDLDVGTLTVNQTLEKPGPAATFGRPKSKSSRRAIPLSAFVVAELRRHRAEQVRQRLILGPAWYDFDLVFTVFDGKPLRSGNFRRDVYDPLIVTAKVPRIRFHDLRHSHATMLLVAGVHPKVVSERLGHSGITLTMDTYSHVMPGLQKDATDTLDRRLFRAG